jgi:hypothetical protein
MEKEYVTPIDMPCELCGVSPVCSIMHIHGTEINCPVCHDCGCRSEADIVRTMGLAPYRGTPGDDPRCMWCALFSVRLGVCLCADCPDKCGVPQ